MKFEKPIVVVSKCLNFDACRYNGAVIPEDFVLKLQKHVTFLPICPEVEIGLGVPRDPIKIVQMDGEKKLIQHSTSQDLTVKMQRFSQFYLKSLDEVDGFILKANSPSCGVKTVKMYPKEEKSAALRERTHGFFTEEILKIHPGLAVEDEGRLTNLRIREHFLTQLFCCAAFRKLKANPTTRLLMKFHEEHKFLFMAYNQTQMRMLGRIAANSNKRDISKVMKEYEQEFYSMFKKLPSHRSHINTLEHGLGYFKKELTAKEKSFFLSSIQKYADEKIPLTVLLHMLQMWIEKYDETYLESQRYFEPFPYELIEMRDSSKGRAIIN